jgi:gamma-butyrobetaine dioxygenase
MNRITRYSFTENALTIDWQDGRQSVLAALWLRDHCQMPRSRDPVSRQRLHNITDFPLDIGITNVTQEHDSLIVEFSADSHHSEYSVDWLLQNCYCINQQTDNRSESSKLLWRQSTFDKRQLPRFSYESFCNSDKDKVAALTSVKDYGFVIFEGVPCEDRQVLKVISEFGYVRDTNYGPLFEVRATIDANNLAFTNLSLGCHLDNPYRDPVPGIQLLHCLQSSTTGGESILQDGFMAACILREENSAHFNILSGQWINYRFQDDSTDLQSRVPMFEVNDNNEVIKVRYNNRSIATLNLAPDKIMPFYEAYRHYAEILQRKPLQIRFKLEPGELMMFDNTRVMHARDAYSTGGKRHLQGAYCDLDGMYSTLNVLNQKSHLKVENKTRSHP